jgi:predicted enzyme related to lactoylglutathione lyase
VIAGVAKVIVPVEDQARAKEFWTERAGFTVRQDEAYGEERWIEVAPPAGGPVLVLSPRPADQPRPHVPAELPHSPVFFTCADIGRTYAEMRERGVDFPAPPQRVHFGSWALFADQEGTRYALGEWQ